MSKKKEHPWLAFLTARLDVIEWLSSNDAPGGNPYSDEQIRSALNVDPVQLQLLKMTIRDRSKP